jgi:hypothetical protein
MHDAGAAAAAKVSAGRVLKELYGEELLGISKPVGEMTMAELDAEIARMSMLLTLTRE